MVTASAGRVLAALLCALPALRAADFPIDHVTVAGSNLAAMRDAFTAATGIATEYGGRHTNHATEMAVVSFPDGSYLELMATVPNADPAAVAAHEWSRFLTGNAGPCGFALRAPNLAAEAATLKSRGILTSAVQPGGRVRADGVRLAWQIVNVGPPPRGSLFPFLIADDTPRANRVYPTGKPTTERFRGIAKVVVGVKDLETAIAQYRTAFALPEPRRQTDAHFGARLAWFEHTPFVLAAATGDDSWLARRVREYGDAPCAIVLASETELTGAIASNWFGQAVVWMDPPRLGWHLGAIASR